MTRGHPVNLETHGGSDGCLAGTADDLHEPSRTVFMRSNDFSGKHLELVNGVEEPW